MPCFFKSLRIRRSAARLFRLLCTRTSRISPSASTAYPATLTSPPEGDHHALGAAPRNFHQPRDTTMDHRGPVTCSEDQRQQSEEGGTVWRPRASLWCRPQAVLASERGKVK